MTKGRKDKRSKNKIEGKKGRKSFFKEGKNYYHANRFRPFVFRPFVYKPFQKDVMPRKKKKC